MEGLHYPQTYGMGLGEVGGQQQQQQQPTSPAGVTEEAVGLAGQEAGAARGHANINTILDQIMNITDQSLDEAQVSLCALSFLVKHSNWASAATLYSAVSLVLTCACELH